MAIELYKVDCIAMKCPLACCGLPLGSSAFVGLQKGGEEQVCFIDEPDVFLLFFDVVTKATTMVDVALSPRQSPIRRKES